MPEKPQPNGLEATGAAWAVLIGMGGTSVTYNVYHAVSHGTLNLGLALLYGIAPVFAAALLSHIVAQHDGGRFLQAVTFTVMLGAMALSIGATAAVVKPTAGPWMQWLFGLVLDAAALVALRVILSGHARREAETTALEVARQEALNAGTAAREAAGKTAELENELAAVKAALEAERQRASARKPRRSSARKPARSSARNNPLASAPEAGTGSAGSSGAEAELDDLGTEAQALKILASEPGISGSQLGLRLGKSDRYGRDLIKRLAATAKEG